MDALLRRELPEDVERSLRKIQDELRLFEDDNAEALLGELIRGLDKEVR